MQIGEEEIRHIADLACLKINDNEIVKYIKDMQEIITLANEVNNIDTEGLDETIGANSKINAFRKDEVKDFEDKEALLQNAPSKEDGMFKLPKMFI